MKRRGNGLSADTYAPLVDLAPHLADALLAALGEAGVAAYATSPAGLPDRAEPNGPSGETVAGDVLDRLYVDVTMKPTAEGILRAHLARLRDGSARDAGGSRDTDGARRTGGARDAVEAPDAAEAVDAADGRDAAERSASEPAGSESGRDDQAAAERTGSERTSAERPAAERTGSERSEGPERSASGRPAADDAPPAERDEDAIWAEIIAGFDSGPEGDDVPWPEEENVREPADPPREGDDRTGRLPRARVIRPAHPPGATPDADDDDHFIPPPPPPLPSADPLTKGAWIALIGGPLYLLVTVILDWEVPGWAAFLAVAAFIGGFVTLVLRMGDEPRDPDDGAVV